MLNAKLILGESNSQTKSVEKVLSVSDNKEIGTYILGSKEDVDLAYKEASNSQRSWENTPLFDRYNMFKKVSEELLQRKEELAKILSEEIAKPIKDALSEVERTSDLILQIAEYTKTIRFEVGDGDSQKGYKKNQKLGIFKKVPVGVVLCISPFNYPMNLAASKIAPALISGNTVVFKPASQGVLSGYLLADIFNKYLPKGVLTFVSGKASEIGDYLLTHKSLNMINFTGSTEVGDHIREICKVPYLLELGGKDYAVVSNKANIEKAVSEIVKGAFSYSGQRCTGVKGVIIQEGIYSRVVESLKESISKLKVGKPNEEVTVSYLINDKAAAYVRELVDEAERKGAKLSWQKKAEGKLIYPLLLEITDISSRIMHEEQFGPVLPVYKVKDLSEAIKIVNSSKFGLQADVFTDDINEAFTLANELNVGTVQINGKSDRGPDSFPFTGVKGSGSGTQGIKESILGMMRDKAIVLNL